MEERGRVLGQTVRRLRLERGLSQVRLADLAGISEPYVIQIERGKHHRVSGRVLSAIARALGVSTDTLLDEAAAGSMPDRDDSGEAVIDPDLDEHRILTEFRELARRRWNADAIVLMRTDTDREGEAVGVAGSGLEMIRMKGASACFLDSLRPSAYRFAPASL